MVTLVLWPRDYHELLFSCLFRYNVDVDILKEIEHEGDTVDGRDPAPVEVGNSSPLFTKLYTSRVVSRISCINRMKGLQFWWFLFLKDPFSSTPCPCHRFLGGSS